MSDFLLSQLSLGMTGRSLTETQGLDFRPQKRKRQLTVFRQFTLIRQRSVDLASVGGVRGEKSDWKSRLKVGMGLCRTGGNSACQSAILRIVMLENRSDFGGSGGTTVEQAFPSSTLRHPSSYWNGVCNTGECFIAGQAEAGTRCVPRPGLFLEGAERRYSTSIHRIRSKQHRRV